MAYHRYQQNDEPSQPDGDLGFVGVEMRQHPSQLPPGYAAQAVNMRFESGIAETRKGSVKLAWTNKITAGDILPWGTVYGRGKYLDSAAREWLITAADGGVYASLANNPTRSIALPDGVTITSPVTFEQGGQALVMMRGFDLDSLLLTSLAEGFTAAPPTIDPLLFSPLPRGVKAIWVADRLWVMAADDQVWASDELDVTTYAEEHKYSINSGAADPLVTIVPFGRTDIICLKRHSVHRLTSIVGDLAGTQALPITRRYGCVAAKAVADVGTDLIWLSDEGIASLTLTQYGELQAMDGTLERQQWFSDPIQPLINRINGANRGKAVFEIWERHLYCAVPLDTAVVEQPELIGSGTQYKLLTTYVVSGLVAGATYRYRPGANEATLTNGADTLTYTGDFVAAGTSVTLTKTAGVDVTASLKRVFKGVNTAILVYNFKNTAWSGYDSSEAWNPQDLFLASFADRQRLFLVGSDGWITLYEEGYADALPAPYLEIEVTSTPAAGKTLSVNGGTVATTTASSVNVGAAWGIGTPAPDLATARDNLWADSNNAGGYRNGTWTAPNCTIVLSGTAVRFYGNNGVLPVATFSLGAAGLTFRQVTQAAIASRLRTRGYLMGKPLDLKRANDLTLQLQTWSPNYTVTIIAEGQAKEDIVLESETRDRTRYTQPFNKRPYNVNNSGDNFGDPHREDYSVTFPVLDNAFSRATIDLGENLITLDTHQEATLQLRGSQSLSRSPQIDINNVDGRIKVLAAGLEGFETNRRKGTFA